MRRSRFLRALLGFIAASTTVLSSSMARAEPPAGQMTLAHNITLAPRWFDPAESEALVTPFIFYYALHDALVKPMPGNPMSPCLAESWTASPDGVAYEFVLRKGVRF